MSARPSIATNLTPLVDAGVRFRTVYADPPWQYSNIASRGAANNHYTTLGVKEICAEPVGELVDDDAHLHLWTTSGFLREAFTVIEAWGFQCKSCMVLGQASAWDG